MCVLVLVDGWRTTRANVKRILPDVPSVSPEWPESPGAPVEMYEAALLAVIPPTGRLIILTHSYGSCVVERCIHDGRLPWSRIERLVHYSPLFCFSRFDRFLIHVTPGWMPVRFKKAWFTKELWDESLHPRRGIRMRHVRELLRATDGLCAVYGQVHAVRDDPMVCSPEAFCNKYGVSVEWHPPGPHRRAWEAIESSWVCTADC
jgi:hypothetical protein